MIFSARPRKICKKIYLKKKQKLNRNTQEFLTTGETQCKWLEI